MRSRALATLLRLPLLLLLPWTAPRSGLVGVQAALLLEEDFSCRMMGCDSHRITNLTYWRHSTTGSNQSYLSIGPASGGRTGNEVNFSVSWCRPPHPNPHELGCYRSELALQRDVQATLVDWTRGEGSSQRWFGFSNRLLDYTWETPASDRAASEHGLNGPSFQLHGEDKEPSHSGHPVLNLQVDARGCAQGNNSCPVWTVGVSAGGKPNPACSEQYDRCWVLGPALVPGSALGFGGWNDWVINWRGSPKASLGHLEIWRNGELVLPKQMLATAYDDPEGPYLKFGVYHSQWKGEVAPPPVYARVSAIAYGGLRVGDARSSYAEVSTKQHY